MGIIAELNRAVLETDAFDQNLRRRLAEHYGGLIDTRNGCHCPFAWRPATWPVSVRLRLPPSR
ncbi:hypothetical protein [Nonomuraea basaltis]|uniref:hypothetical protein n=1 Tax=Nonomuraea basaltis TaxID=2495887 RepID=UPI00110C64CA|nr:hypothetical protein [Nonomuraea basaltis]TMR95100.1 hypothetical protein EJK15_30275 [Nonomuraea basaltis]